MMNYLYSILALFFVLIIDIVMTILLYKEDMHLFWTILTTSFVVIIGWFVIFIIIDKIIPRVKIKRFFKEIQLSELKEVQGKWTTYEKDIYQMRGFSCHKMIMKDNDKTSTFFMLEKFDIPQEHMHKVIQLKTLDLIVIAYKVVDIS